MKDVRCINSRNYRLTVGQTYLANDEEEGWYRLVNDAGRNVRYARELFEDVVTESTMEEVLASLRVQASDDHCRVSFVMDGQNYDFNTRNVTQYEMNISCGIQQIGGLTGLYSNIAEQTSNCRLNITDEIFKRTINALVQETGEEENCGIVLFSTNTNCANFNRIEAVFTELSPNVNPKVHNPNSGNEIVLWAVPTEATHTA